jgi:RNA polymerase sigma-32 factor
MAKVNKINNLEPLKLSKDEQARLALVYKNTNDSNALEQLVRANVRLAAKIAHKYKRAGIDVEDLIAEGIGGIIHSVNKYQPEKGASFTSFASNWIRARIQEYVQNNCTTIRVGTRTAKQLYASLPRLRREYGEALTTDIIAQELNLKPSDVASTLAYMSKRTLDINHKPNADGRALSEVIGDSDLSIEQRAIEQEHRAIVSKLCNDFIATLNERDSYIYKHRILCILQDCNRTPAQQLSERLGITKQRISQIEKSLKNRLAQYLLGADIFG